jgi:hypothetical protein
MHCSIFAKYVLFNFALRKTKINFRKIFTKIRKRKFCVLSLLSKYHEKVYFNIPRRFFLRLNFSKKLFANFFRLGFCGGTIHRPAILKKFLSKWYTFKSYSPKLLSVCHINHTMPSGPGTKS